MRVDVGMIDTANIKCNQHTENGLKSKVFCKHKVLRQCGQQVFDALKQGIAYVGSCDGCDTKKHDVTIIRRGKNDFEVLYKHIEVLHVSLPEQEF